MEFKEIADLSLQAALIVAVVTLWRRVTTMTDSTIAMLLEARTERHKMRAEMTALTLAADKAEQERGASP
jgi:hypothetical protein